MNLSDKVADGCEVEPPYDKMLIVGRLGMKPESLSRAFSQLKPEGVKINRNHSVAADTQCLRDYAENNPSKK